MWFPSPRKPPKINPSQGGIKGAYNDNFLWTGKKKKIFLPILAIFVQLDSPFPVWGGDKCWVSVICWIPAGRQCVPCHGCTAAHPHAAGLSWYVHAVVSPAWGMSPSGLSPSSPKISRTGCCSMRDVTQILGVQWLHPAKNCTSIIALCLEQNLNSSPLSQIKAWIN